MIGKIISHYKIVEQIGSGGMGVVYKAEDTKLKRTVALKFLPPDLTRDEDTKKRFIHEAQSASALEHNNICNIHEIDETADGQLFMAMAFYEGETLKKKIEGEKLLPIEEILDIVIQIAQGLTIAHESKIIHRDLKPANIMITDRGEVKIVDFGLAKLAGQTKLTKEGTTLGTVGYMSPEQVRGEEVDHRSDIWQLGVILYEMITGQLPFKGDYDQAVVYTITSEEPEPVSGLRSGISMELERIVKRILSKDSQDRYQHADDLLSELNHLKKDSDSDITPVKPESKKKKNIVLFPAVVLSIVVLIIAGYLFFSPKVEGTNRIPIAVIDFVNETNEPELSGLSGMLITSLEQSRRLSVLTRSRMFDVLKQLKIKDTEQIDESLGRKICKQAGVNTLAMASIRKFGKVYSIDFKVLDVKKNKYLFTAKEQGEGQESIPAMIDDLSEKTRKGLKEHADEIQAASRKVAEVTTQNLEAYQHYFKGEEYINKLKFEEAEEELKKAISLDSTFGLAYYRFAYTLNWEHSPIQAKKQIDNAVKYIDNIPEKEKYLVRAVKAIVDSGWGEAALKILRDMEKIYPNDKEMLYNIGDISYHIGDYQVSLNYLKKVIEIDPNSVRTLQHLTYTYQDSGLYKKMLESAKHYVTVSESAESYNLFAKASVLTGKLEEGLEWLLQYRESNPNFYFVSRSIANLHSSNEQYDEAEKELKTFVEKDKPTDVQHKGYDYLARFYPYVGKYRQAVAVCDKVTEFYWQKKDTVMAMYWIANKALYTIRGWNDLGTAKEIIEESYPYQKKLDYSEWYYEIFAMLCAYQGDYELANNLAKTSARAWGMVIRTLIHAEKLECNTVESFVEEVLKETNLSAKIIVLYHHARCLYKQGQFEKAKNRLLKLQTLGDDGFGYRAVYFSKSFYLLGKIYEEMGEYNQAIKNYEKFLKMWKNADEDLPEFIDARKRHAKLIRKN